MTITPPEKQSGSTTRRKFVSSGLKSIAGAGALHAGLISLNSTANAKGLTELTVQFDWLMSNGQLGEVVALKRGYFAEEGLSVTFNPGGPNAQTIPPVLSGRANTGQFSESGQAIAAHGNGLPIRIFACGFQHAPFAFFSLPRAPVRSPRDMIGKRIGIQPTARFVLDMILAKHEIDPSQLDILSMGFDMGALVTGQLDVVTGWQTNTKALSILGPERIDFLPQQAGIDSYANVYFASIRDFERNKAAFTAYLSAIARGWGWAYHNREESVDILVDAYPNLDRTIEKATVDLIMKLAFTEETAHAGWGTFNQDKLQTQIDLYTKHELFRGSAPVYESFATQEILENTKHVRLKA